MKKRDYEYSEDDKFLRVGAIVYEFVEHEDASKSCNCCQLRNCIALKIDLKCTWCSRKDLLEGYWIITDKEHPFKRKRKSDYRDMSRVTEEEKFLIGILL